MLGKVGEERATERGATAVDKEEEYKVGVWAIDDGNRRRGDVLFIGATRGFARSNPSTVHQRRGLSLSSHSSRLSSVSSVRPRARNDSDGVVS